MDEESGKVGSVGEEAAKLMGAVRDWARESGDPQVDLAAQALGEGLRSVADHVGHGRDCALCPVCQAIRLARQTHPEVRAHLAAAIGSLAEAATAALRNMPQPAHGSEPSATDAPTRIDLDD